MLLYAFGNDHIGTLGTSKATVQIELGGVATPYKPFEKETLNLITPTGLPGIPVDSDGNYTDENGQTKPLARGRIKLAVKGGELLAFGSACPYYPESYQSNETDTYYGEAMVIVKPDTAKELFVKAESPYGSAVAKVLVMKNKEATAYIEEVCHA